MKGTLIIGTIASAAGLEILLMVLPTYPSVAFALGIVLGVAVVLAVEDWG